MDTRWTAGTRQSAGQELSVVVRLPEERRDVSVRPDFHFEEEVPDAGEDLDFRDMLLPPPGAAIDDPGGYRVVPRVRAFSG
jgi:hypothetical protein